MHSPSARAFSLLEVVVASAILGIILLATASLLITLQRGNAHISAVVDLGQQSRKVQLQLRRELRQSGYGYWSDDDQSQVTLTHSTNANGGSNTTLRFAVRTGLPDPSAGDSRQYWATIYTYEVEASDTLPNPSGGTYQRYDLFKSVEQETYDSSTDTYSTSTVLSKARVAEGLGRFHIAPPSDATATDLNGDEALDVTIQVLRSNGDWSGGTPEPHAITISERMPVYNRKRTTARE